MWVHSIRKEEAADEKPCPLMGEWSLARNPSRNGHEVFQDLWHFKCFGWDRRRRARRWRGIGDWRWRGQWVRDRQRRQEWRRWRVNCIVSWKLPCIQNGSFRSDQFYKSSLTNSFNLCLLFIGTWLQADSGIWVTFPLVLTSEKKKID